MMHPFLVIAITSYHDSHEHMALHHPAPTLDKLF